MRRLFLAVSAWILITTASISFASIHPPVSQLRGATESFESALLRHLEKSRDYAQDISVESAQSVATEWSKIDTSAIPEWSSGVLSEAFNRVRDARFLHEPEMPDFARRSSWLYPDDGCFARAALAGQNLENWGYRRPKKLFAFGELDVRTANAPGGTVHWWYHIVPVVRVGGAVMVLDPAVEPQRALTVEEWSARMGGTTGSLLFSLCSSTTYDPDTSCSDPASDSEDPALEHQYRFLDLEWDRLTELGRNPERELGSDPPWSASQ